MVDTPERNVTYSPSESILFLSNEYTKNVTDTDNDTNAHTHAHLTSDLDGTDDEDVRTRAFLHAIGGDTHAPQGGEGGSGGTTVHTHTQRRVGDDSASSPTSPTSPTSAPSTPGSREPTHPHGLQEADDSVESSEATERLTIAAKALRRSIVAKDIYTHSHTLSFREAVDKRSRSRSRVRASTSRSTLTTNDSDDTRGGVVEGVGVEEEEHSGEVRGLQQVMEGEDVWVEVDHDAMLDEESVAYVRELDGTYAKYVSVAPPSNTGSDSVSGRIDDASVTSTQSHESDVSESIHGATPPRSGMGNRSPGKALDSRSDSSRFRRMFSAASFTRLFKFGGSPSPITILRHRLARYERNLNLDMALSATALASHSDVMQQLVDDDLEQQRQLLSWGLDSLAHDFHRLNMLRITRINICQEMETHSLNVIRLRAEEARFLQQSSDDNISEVFLATEAQNGTGTAGEQSKDWSSGSNPEAYARLNSALAFFESPGALRGKDHTIKALVRRINFVDVAIRDVRRKFEAIDIEYKLMLRAKGERRQNLIETAVRFQHTTEHRERRLQALKQLTSGGDPKALMNSFMKHILGNDAKDDLKRRRLERKYSEIIEDERTREGRLLKRWYELSIRKVAGVHTSPTGDITSPRGTVPESPSMDGGSGVLVQHRKRSNSLRTDGRASTSTSTSMPVTTAMTSAITSPRSINAFINYFVETILKESYDLGSLDDGAFTPPPPPPAALTPSSSSPSLSRTPPNESLTPPPIRHRRSSTPYSAGAPGAEGGSGWSPRPPTYKRFDVRSVSPEEQLAAVRSITKHIVFRRIWVTLFDDMTSKFKKRHREWRSRVRRLRLLTPEDFGVPEEFVPSRSRRTAEASEATPSAPERERDRSSSFSSVGDGDSAVKANRGPYWRSSAILSRVTSCVVPDDMLYYVLAAMVMVHREAMEASGKQMLDADTLFPILVYVIINSNLPFIHSTLYFIRGHAVGNSAGEAAYYLTCIEAAVSSAMKMKIPEECQGVKDSSEEEEEDDAAVEEGGQASPPFHEELPRSKAVALNGRSARDRGSSANGSTEPDNSGTENRPTRGSSADVQGPGFQEPQGVSEQEERNAMMQLGSWLGAQKAMEDTIDVLEQEGWMM